MDTMWQDVKFGARMLRKNRGITLIAVLTLALGIGANTAIFNVVNAVLLRPLPYPNAHELVFMQEWLFYRPERPLGDVSVPDFVDWRAQSASFQHMVAYDETTTALSGDGHAERLPMARVSPGYFEMLGISPILGRTFQPDEEKWGNHFSVLISHELWQRRYQGNPAIIGKPITLDARDCTVVGILPQGFQMGDSHLDVWRPFAFHKDWLKDRSAHFFTVLARRKAGVTLQQVRAEMTGIAARLAEVYPADNKGRGVRLVDLRDEIVGDQRRPLAVLMGAVGLLLLIACANVAGLLLSRATTREREMAIRSALGASRARLMRQLVVESVVLAVAGGALGILLAVWATDGLLQLGAERIGRLHEVRFDGMTLGFVSLVSLASGVFFGMIPAWQVSRASLHTSMKEGSAGAGSARQKLRGALVVAEVALALILVTGAGLLMESFTRLLQVNPGFRPQGLFAFSFSLPSTNYEKHAQIVSFATQALERARRLPGVEGAALTTSLAFSPNWWSTFVYVTGKPESREEQVTTYFRINTPDYFRVMQIPLKRGRYFTEHDRAGTPNVAIVNESLSERLFPQGDPLGKHITIDGSDLEIVGVVGDTRQRSLDSSSGMEAYASFWQFPYYHFSLVTRAGGGVGPLLAGMKTEIAQLDPDVPLEKALSMEELVAGTVVPRRFSVLLMGFFAAVALLLAALGLYGVLAYTVSQRTREIGVRLALGAQRGDVLRMILRQGLALTLVGAFLGVCGALAVTRFLQDLLFDVSAFDPGVFLAVVLAVVCVGAAACLVPARRAMRIEPMQALRYE